MGGIGSGRLPGFGRPTCEEVSNIGILLYAQKGVLKPGHRTSVNWIYGEEEIGTGFLDVSHDNIVLTYQFQDDDETKRQRETIELSFTNPPFGGSRPWFICPACGVRRLKLFYLGQFLCRICHGLNYQCTREDYPRRLLRRYHKVCDHLDGMTLAGEFIAWRPKGMHRRTFAGIMERQNTLSNKLRAAEMTLFVDESRNANRRHIDR